MKKILSFFMLICLSIASISCTSLTSKKSIYTYNKDYDFRLVNWNCSRYDIIQTEQKLASKLVSNTKTGVAYSVEELNKKANLVYCLDKNNSLAAAIYLFETSPKNFSTDVNEIAIILNQHFGPYTLDKKNHTLIWKNKNTYIYIAGTEKMDSITLTYSYMKIDPLLNFLTSFSKNETEKQHQIFNSI